MTIHYIFYSTKAHKLDVFDITAHKLDVPDLTLHLLQHIKLGVFDVIPSNSLEGLTAEDLRLLLNGVGDINVQTLISYTSFNDESGTCRSVRVDVEQRCILKISF